MLATQGRVENLEDIAEPPAFGDLRFLGIEQVAHALFAADEIRGAAPVEYRHELTVIVAANAG